MPISLYDASVGTYQQVLGGVVAVLEKGAQHFQARDKSPDEMVNKSLYPDMLPFSFQITSVAFHSLGCIRALEAGLCQPPQDEPERDYAGLQALVAETLQQLQQITQERVEALSGRPVMFKAGEFELPFTAENFVLSFSLPNLYFHATTAYDLLRMEGVGIGKVDFLGAMRLAV